MKSSTYASLAILLIAIISLSVSAATNSVVPAKAPKAPITGQTNTVTKVKAPKGKRPHVHGTNVTESATLKLSGTNAPVKISGTNAPAAKPAKPVKPAKK